MAGARSPFEWGAVWQERLEFGAPPVSLEVHEAFVAAIATSRKVLDDQYYDGYLLDVMIDADSDLICAIDVLPANADEAANAKNLIESEEAAHGNDIESLSIDAIGFNGAV
ncbi:MAG: hypothetical protein AAB401_13040, partial [Acidobacteriota bacterium]